MTSSMLHDTVITFLTERGLLPTSDYPVDQPLVLGSLDYVALLLHVEQDCQLTIDDGVFFADGLPETLASICARLDQAIAQSQE